IWIRARGIGLFLLKLQRSTVWRSGFGSMISDDDRKGLGRWLVRRSDARQRSKTCWHRRRPPRGGRRAFASAGHCQRAISLRPVALVAILREEVVDGRGVSPAG